MIQIQIFAIKHVAAVLAHVLVPLEDIVPSEFDFLLRQAVEHHEQDHARDANPERNCANAFRMRLLLREVLPFAEIESIERAVTRTLDSVRVTFKKQSQGAPGGTDIDSFPSPVQHQHLLV